MSISGHVSIEHIDLLNELVSTNAIDLHYTDQWCQFPSMSVSILKHIDLLMYIPAYTFVNIYADAVILHLEKRLLFKSEDGE